MEKIAEICTGNSDLPSDKRYAVIYADPPWRYEFSETESRAIENQYPTMTLDDICASAFPASTIIVVVSLGYDTKTEVTGLG